METKLFSGSGFQEKFRQMKAARIAKGKFDEDLMREKMKEEAKKTVEMIPGLLKEQDNDKDDVKIELGIIDADSVSKESSSDKTDEGTPPQNDRDDDDEKVSLVDGKSACFIMVY